MHLLFTLTTNFSQFSLLISLLVKNDSCYCAVILLQLLYRASTLRLVVWTLCCPTTSSPVAKPILAPKLDACKGQSAMHIPSLSALPSPETQPWACSASQRGHCVFWGKYGWQSTVSPPSLAVCNTHQLPQSTDATRGYLISASAVRYNSNPSRWNFCHKLFNAAVIGCFTVSYWWGNNQLQQDHPF